MRISGSSVPRREQNHDANTRNGHYLAGWHAFAASPALAALARTGEAAKAWHTATQSHLQLPVLSLFWVRHQLADPRMAQDRRQGRIEGQAIVLRINQIVKSFVQRAGQKCGRLVSVPAR